MREKVLLADDNLTVQRIVAATLRGGGFDVAVVDDGPAALDSVKAAPPDLILADFNLEGINLLAFAKRAREEKALSDVTIWALVGPTDTYDAGQLRSVGIQSCLKKPIDSLHLLQEVKSHFPGDKTGTEPTLLLASTPMESAAKNLSASQTFPSERVESALLLLSAPEVSAPQHESAPQIEPLPATNNIPLSFCPVVQPTAQPTVQASDFCAVPDVPMLPADVVGGDVRPSEIAVETIPTVENASPASPILTSECLPVISESLPYSFPIMAAENQATPSNGVLNGGDNTAVPTVSPIIPMEQVEQAVASMLPEILRSILTPDQVHAALEKVAREIVPPMAEAEIVKEIKRLEPVDV